MLVINNMLNLCLVLGLALTEAIHQIKLSCLSHIFDLELSKTFCKAQCFKIVHVKTGPNKFNGMFFVQNYIIKLMNIYHFKEQ